MNHRQQLCKTIEAALHQEIRTPIGDHIDRVGQVFYEAALDSCRCISKIESL